MSNAIWSQEERELILSIWKRQQKSRRVPKLSFVRPGPFEERLAESLVERGFLLVSRYYPHMPCYALSQKSHDILGEAHA